LNIAADQSVGSCPTTPLTNPSSGWLEAEFGEDEAQDLGDLVPVPSSSFNGHSNQSNVDIRSKYLEGIPTFNINTGSTIACATRDFLSQTYGGHTQQLIAHMNRSRTKEHPAIFPDPDYNSYLPTRRGVPGLVFTGRRDVLQYNNWRLFVKSSKRLDGHIVQEYLGQYDTSELGDLTPAEFRNQSQKVQNKLAGAVLTKTWREYKTMRARIFFRKCGKLPSDKAAIEKVIAKEINTPCKYGDRLSVRDVLDAFLRGDEVFQVILLKCIGYDYDFARDIAEEYPNFDHTSKSEKVNKTKGASSLASGSGVAGQPRQSNRKRKRSQRVDDDSGSD